MGPTLLFFLLCAAAGQKPATAPHPIPSTTAGGDSGQMLQAVWTGHSYAYVLWPPAAVTAPPVLIDGGSDASAAALQSALGARGVAIESIEAVLLTHGHSHHTAGLARMPHSAIYASFADAPLVRGDGPLGNIWLSVLQRLRAPVRQPRALRPLRAGQRLQLSGHTLEVVALPGHTKGSVGFAVLGGLIAGDAVYGPSLAEDNLRPYPAWAAQSPKLAAATLGRIKCQDLRFIADGHTGLTWR